MTLPLLRILSDGAYHSIQSLADRLKISEQSVANILNDSISSSDIDLAKTQDHRYCWKNPIHWLDRNSILKHQKKINIDLHLLDHIDSTNNYLSHLIKKKT